MKLYTSCHVHLIVTTKFCTGFKQTNKQKHNKQNNQTTVWLTQQPMSNPPSDSPITPERIRVQKVDVLNKKHTWQRLSSSPRGLTFTWWGCYGLCLDINQPSLPTPFYSFRMSISVFMSLSTIFQSINSPHNSPFSQSVLPVLSLPCRSFQLYISLRKSPTVLI